MNNSASTNKINYLKGLTKNMLEGVKYAVLPGDPKRAKNLSQYLDVNSKHIFEQGQHSAYIAQLEGQKILLISTGMGCPAISLVTENLAILGIKHFIRLGTSGTIRRDINLGEIVISRGAVKLDGASSQFADTEFPAVASFKLTKSFKKAAEEESIPYHIGITASSDTFWPGQERYDNYIGNILRTFQGSINEWHKLNVYNFEMEASAFFTLCSTFNLEAVCFCGVIAKRNESEKPSVEAKNRAKDNWQRLLKAGLLNDMKEKGYLI